MNVFDVEVTERLVAAASDAAAQPVTLATPEQKAARLRALATARDVLDTALAEGLAELRTSEAFVDLGAPSALAWARADLRLDHRAAARLEAAGRTLGRLDRVADAARTGRVGLDHVAALTTAVTTLGAETVAEAQDWLLDVATTAEPAALRGIVRGLREAVDPDALDAAYERGMERHDLRLAPTTGGVAVTGFLDPVTGTALSTWLSSAAAPTDADDERTPAQRRVQAVHDLVTSALEHGLPTDRGVRPQVHVVVDADTLAGHPLAPPAELTGHGAIGPALLARIACDAVARAVTTGGHTDGGVPQTRVLDVGRARRLATPAQRIAVLHRQHGRCATPGCGATHLDVHHVRPWSAGGPTDLDNLVGLCARCHGLVHLDRLAVTPDGHGGFVLGRGTGRLDDRRRALDHTVRRRLRALRRAVRADVPGAVTGTASVNAPVTAPSPPPGPVRIVAPPSRVPTPLRT